MDEFEMVKVIGQGARTFVFEVAKGEVEVRVLKLFEKEDEYTAELTNLNKLGNSLQGVPQFKHVPHVDRQLMLVTEAISGREYQGIISLPLCVPIRPQRCGKRLERQHYLQLLSTLKLVHAKRMYNADIKPSNVMMHGDDAVICDWGAAVFATGDSAIPETRTGTIGYSDFTLLLQAAPNASHDLMALVRTIYANYTHQRVPSDQDGADFFWQENFREGSLWKTAMEYALEVNYDKLEEVFMRL